MADSKSESDWISSRISLFGAGSALAGAFIGALTSAAIAWWGFERQEDAANRSAEERAYVEFLQLSDALVFDLRYGDSLNSSGDIPTIDRIEEAQTLVFLFGSDDASEACDAMANGLVAGIRGSKNKERRESDKTWKEYDNARNDFQKAVQDSLEIH